MSRYLAVGDIHGNLKALEQVLERSNFDYENDTLIGIGDYCDGHNYSSEVVQKLLEIPNFIGILGNHDVWVREWLIFGTAKPIWIEQGGRATRDSYIKTGHLINPDHKEFFNDLHQYYILELNGKKYAFVHGGYTSRQGLGHEDYNADYYWDRKLWDHSLNKTQRKYTDIRTSMYDRVFIGHTSTYFDYPKESSNPPFIRSNIINLDQGAGYDGYLTICDIETEECWQSDLATDLYEGFVGR